MRPKNDLFINGVVCENESATNHSIVNGNTNGFFGADIVDFAIAEICIDSTNEIREACKEWILTDDQCKKYMDLLLSNIHRGLKKETHPEAIVKCFVTYVQDLPKGTETGKYLALDLGGTNFRVLLVELKGQDHCEMKSEIYATPQSIMTGPGEDLFNHIAKCLSDFIAHNNLQTEILPLGFTFSFPLQQLGLRKGKLVRWTKGFSCSDVVGQDVVALLEEAIVRAGLKIDICAVLNDTTGTLMSCAWANPDCRIGLIVGTGTNVCYVEKVENAELFDGDKGKPNVLINTEWGAFGDDGCLDFIRNHADIALDNVSINVAKQLHEKMISGMYLGELARYQVVKCVEQGILFDGKLPEKMKESYSFETKYISEIEAEPRGKFDVCKKILAEMGYGTATDQDCANLRFICEVVSSRAAHMVASGLSTIINKMGEEKVTVGIDGSVYRFHPKFHDLLVKKMNKLVNPGIKFDVMLSHDGSGRGAALIAAVAANEYREERRKSSGQAARI